MSKIQQTRLRVPADSRFLAMVQGHARDLAMVAGLSQKEVLALELATEELARYVGAERERVAG